MVVKGRLAENYTATQLFYSENTVVVSQPHNSTKKNQIWSKTYFYSTRARVIMILHRIDICNWGVSAKCSPNLQRPANRRWKDICLSSQMHARARARPRALAVLSESLTRPCHRLTGCWHNLTSAKCLPLGPDSIYCLNHSSVVV